MRSLKRLSFALLILALVLSLGGIWLSRRSFPMIDGRVAVRGISAEVKVVRDTDGVPHVYAENEHDLYFAQGYVHAQERFWQMDFWRHIGQGRLSEMFGESQLDTDIFLRSLGFTALAQAELAAAPQENRDVLAAYAEGVNAYIASRSPSQLSLEYAVLALQNRGYVPEPWEPIDTLTWARMMAWELRSNMDEEIERAAAAAAVGFERASQLFPAFPDDKLTTLGGSGSRLPQPASSALMAAIRPALDDLVEKEKRLAALLGPTGLGIGSNNWVVSGTHTASGLPLLADDPHLAVQMPSIWFENSLHCDACGTHLTGFSFAGVPGVIIGHNDRIAWGVTNFGPDTMDLFIEKVNPANPDEYEVDGVWHSVETRSETIVVAGADPVEIEVRSTRHGPVVTGIYGPADQDYAAAVGEVPDRFVVALQWAALRPSTLLSAILGINRATNWDEFRAAVRLWDIASQNIVYADVDGNIGYQVPGTIPVRRSPGGEYPSIGWTTDTDWIGWVPFEDLPTSFNPASGIIATANQPPWRPGDGPYLGVDFAHGYRGTRIYDVLGSSERPLTAVMFAQLQLDGYDPFAAEVIPTLLGVPGDGPVAAAQGLLVEWTTGDEAFQASSDSAPAALFYAVWEQIMARTFRDELPEVAWPGGGGRWFTVVRSLMATPTDPWWDDAATPDVEERDDILAASLAGGWETVAGRLGSDPQRWRWGDLHTTTFENQSLGQSGIAPIEALFNRGGFQPGGTSSVVNATSWSPGSFEVTWSPSMRMIVDLADFTASRTIHTTGQSGHAFHDHYVDFAPRWETGEYHPMRWSEEQVNAAAAGVLVLVPGG